MKYAGTYHFVRDLNATTIPKALRVYFINMAQNSSHSISHLSRLSFYLGNPTITDLYIILGVSICCLFKNGGLIGLFYIKASKIGSFRFEIPSCCSSISPQTPWIYIIFVPWRHRHTCSNSFCCLVYDYTNWELCLTGMTVYTSNTSL